MILFSSTASPQQQHMISFFVFALFRLTALYIYICTSRLSFDATSRYGSCRFQTNSCLGSHFSTRSVFVRCESLCHHGRYQHRTVARVKIVASSGSIDSVLVMADFEMLPF